MITRQESALTNAFHPRVIQVSVPSSVGIPGYGTNLNTDKPHLSPFSVTTTASLFPLNPAS